MVNSVRKLFYNLQDNLFVKIKSFYFKITMTLVVIALKGFFLLGTIPWEKHFKFRVFKAVTSLNRNPSVKLIFH